MAKINIIPRKNSRKFSRDIKVQYFSNAENERDGIVERTEDYDDEFWAGTSQAIAPDYWHSLRRFRIIDPEDPSMQRELEQNSTALNKLITECEFRYPNNYPDPSLRGRKIESANIFDDKDAFFRHEDLVLRLDSGDGGLDDTNPLNKLFLLILLGKEEFALGGKTQNGPMNSKVRWIVVDANLDRKFKKALRDQDKKARKALADITDNDSNTAKMCLTLGLITEIGTLDKIDLEDLLYEYATDQKTIIPGTTETQQDKFLKTYELGTEILDASYAFSQGFQYGVIKKIDNIYKAFGIILGQDRDTAISFLTIEDQKVLLDRIQMAVDTHLGVKTVTSKTLEDVKISNEDLTEESKQVDSESEEDKEDTTKTRTRKNSRR